MTILTSSSQPSTSEAENLTLSHSAFVGNERGFAAAVYASGRTYSRGISAYSLVQSLVPTTQTKNIE
jgi:hypothetical protein